MRRLTLLLGLALCAPACSTCATEPVPDAAEPLAAAGLTLNDATSATLFVGWPAALRLQAAWMSDTTTPLSLEAGSLTLTVTNAAGATAAWPWRLATTLPASTTLGPDAYVVELAWTLAAEQAAALAPGRYTLRAAWGELRTPPLEVEVATPPASLSVQQRADRARLTADVALLQGDARAALTALDEALVTSPNDPALLGDKAAAHEALGELQPALAAVGAALQAVEAQHPGAGEPPVTLLLAHRRLLDRLVFKDGGQ